MPQPSPYGVPTRFRLGSLPTAQIARASAEDPLAVAESMPPSRRYAITAAISLPRRKRASIRCLASSDSEPRTWNVSLSSAASSWSGPWSGAKATASTSQSPITAQREPRLAVSAARRASAVTSANVAGKGPPAARRPGRRQIP